MRQKRRAAPYANACRAFSPHGVRTFLSAMRMRTRIPLKGRIWSALLSMRAFSAHGSRGRSPSMCCRAFRRAQHPAGQPRKGHTRTRHVLRPFSMAVDGRRRQSKQETGNERCCLLDVTAYSVNTKKSCESCQNPVNPVEKIHCSDDPQITQIRQILPSPLQGLK